MTAKRTAYARSLLLCSLGVLSLHAAGCVRAAGQAATPRAARLERADLGVSAVVEAIDAVQAELVVQGLCSGGESLLLAMEGVVGRPTEVQLYYEVPGVLRIAREAYMQEDGVLVFASDLVYRLYETRASTRTISELDFADVLRRAPIQIRCKIDPELTFDQIARHEKRVERVRQLMSQP